MDFTIIKRELQVFTDKLYENLNADLKQCTTIKEINEILEEEYDNITDYKKALGFKLIENIKGELTDKIHSEDLIKNAIEIENRMENLYIPPIKVEENKMYITEEDIPIDSKEENRNSKSKAVMVILGVIIGAAGGAIVKKNILDAIVIGIIGAAAGVAVYEVTVGKDNNNLEKVIKKDRQVNKRINGDYFDKIVHGRKAQVESIFLEYIDKIDDLFQQVVS